MSNKLLTDTKLRAIAERDVAFRKMMEDEPPTTIMEVGRLLGEMGAHRRLLLDDLHRYRDWCRRFMDAPDIDHVCWIEEEIRAALEDKKP